ncbi:hypothetical protein E2C01_090309 [Portunus trituberculatus]|uniref:Uncharacterized protein n=1 Tax=Portunus trituberculatus TaxID=210409 RepID=A0A5B7JL17_PORTR|nr:hypothetical protein [Portunus trituberculatus]
MVTVTHIYSFHPRVWSPYGYINVSIPRTYLHCLLKIITRSKLPLETYHFGGIGACTAGQSPQLGHAGKRQHGASYRGTCAGK